VSSDRILAPCEVVDRRALTALDPAGERPNDELQEKSVHDLHRNPGADRLRFPRAANSPNPQRLRRRFVRWIKQECLRQIVPLGERHLRAVMREFVKHYHAERNHQGLGNVIPFPPLGSASPVGRIGRGERLGGVLSFYKRNAA
jgi:hypothetical protein